MCGNTVEGYVTVHKNPPPSPLLRAHVGYVPASGRSFRRPVSTLAEQKRIERPEKYELSYQNWSVDIVETTTDTSRALARTLDNRSRHVYTLELTASHIQIAPRFRIFKFFMSSLHYKTGRTKIKPITKTLKKNAHRARTSVRSQVRSETPSVPSETPLPQTVSCIRYALPLQKAFQNQRKSSSNLPLIPFPLEKGTRRSRSEEHLPTIPSR